MAEPVEVWEAADYASLDAGRLQFYYGYEFGHDDEGEVWGFEVKRDGVSVLRISLNELEELPGGVQNDSDCQSMLLFGIGVWLTGGGGA